MDLRAYVRVLRVRWRIVAATTIVVWLAALGYSLVITPQYVSSTKLFVSIPTATSDVSANYQGNLYAQQRVASYAELITGQRLAQRVVDELQLPVSAEVVASEITVQVVPDTVLLTVNVQDPSPSRAQAIATSIGTQFAELVSEIEAPADGTGASAADADPASRVTVAEDPQLPTSPVVPATWRNVAVGVLAGMLLGVALAVLRDRLDNTVKDRKQAATAAQTVPFATIPFDADRPNRPLITFDSGHSISAEAYRQIRTNLQFIDVDAPPRTLVVTSAIPGEGKTTTAINLSLVLAEGGNTVALVEADLRRPRVARYMKLIETVGLTNVLSGAADLDDVLQPSASPGVTVVASGPHPPNPSELLGSSTMRALLADLRSRYDYVVIDAPPLLPVTDAAVLTAAADGAILVSRYGHTKIDQLTRAAENLRTIDARVLGSVLNMVPARSGGSDEYAYYYYDDDVQTPPPADDAPAARITVPQQDRDPEAVPTRNGAATNGAATNGAATNGAATNGAATNGSDTNGAATNGAATNGVHQHTDGEDAAAHRPSPAPRAEDDVVDLWRHPAER